MSLGTTRYPRQSSSDVWSEDVDWANKRNGTIFFLALGSCCLANDEESESSIKCRLWFSCCYSEPCDYRNCSNTTSIPIGANDKPGKKQPKPCLNKNKLLEAVKEALDHGKTLLKNKDVTWWGTGRWTPSAEKAACELKTCVRGKTKPMRDVLQIVSFANFVDKASKYTHWNDAVREEMMTLEKKMMNIACIISASLSNNHLNLLFSTNVTKSVPSDLLSLNSNTRVGVVTYVVLQRIDELFNKLVNSYSTSC